MSIEFMSNFSIILACFETFLIIFVYLSWHPETQKILKLSKKKFTISLRPSAQPNGVPTCVKAGRIYLCQWKVVGNRGILLFHILSRILEIFGQSVLSSVNMYVLYILLSIRTKEDIAYYNTLFSIFG